MIDNELKNIWQGATQQELVKFNKTKLLIELDSKLENFDNKIKNRDNREFFAAVLAIAAFGFGIYYFPGILSKIGLAIGVLYAFLVIYMLKNVKKHRVDNYALPLKEYLNKHREYLYKERNLLDKVLYWYLLPPTVAAILFFIGRGLDSTGLIINISVILVINAFIYALNKRSVKKDFDPLIEKLDIAINDLESKE